MVMPHKFLVHDIIIICNPVLITYMYTSYSGLCPSVWVCDEKHVSQMSHEPHGCMCIHVDIHCTCRDTK